MKQERSDDGLSVVLIRSLWVKGGEEDDADDGGDEDEEEGDSWNRTRNRNQEWM